MIPQVWKALFLYLFKSCSFGKIFFFCFFCRAHSDMKSSMSMDYKKTQNKVLVNMKIICSIVAGNVVFIWQIRNHHPSHFIQIKYAAHSNHKARDKPLEDRKNIKNNMNIKLRLFPWAPTLSRALRKKMLRFLHNDPRHTNNNLCYLEFLNLFISDCVTV